MRVLLQPVGSAPTWLRQVCDRLSRILALPDNWDSYGARGFDPGAAVQALEVLQLVMHEDTPPPAIVPTAAGTLQLEWHTRGVDLEVEFLPSGHLAVSFEDVTAGVEWDKEFGSDLTELAGCIRALHPRG
jgi:hypothetical protein